MFFRFLADLTRLFFLHSDAVLQFRCDLNVVGATGIQLANAGFLVCYFRFHLASGMSAHHHEDCRPNRAKDGNPAE